MSHHPGICLGWEGIIYPPNTYNTYLVTPLMQPVDPGRVVDYPQDDLTKTGMARIETAFNARIKYCQTRDNVITVLVS